MPHRLKRLGQFSTEEKILLRQHVIIPLSGLYVRHGLHALYQLPLNSPKNHSNFTFHAHRFQAHTMFGTEYPHYP